MLKPTHLKRIYIHYTTVYYLHTLYNIYIIYTTRSRIHTAELYRFIVQ